MISIMYSYNYVYVYVAMVLINNAETCSGNCVTLYTVWQMKYYISYLATLMHGF